MTWGGVEFAPPMTSMSGTTYSASGSTEARSDRDTGAGPLAVGQPYVRTVRAHWRVVAVFTLAVLAGAVLVLVLRSPTYEATAKLLVSPVEPTDGRYAGLPVVQQLGDPTRTIQTAASLVESREIADAAARELGEPWTGERVRDAITVSPQGQTNVLEVEASAGDADDAAAVANAYAAAAIDVRAATLEDQVDATIERLRGDLAQIGPEDAATSEALQARLAELEVLRVNGDPSVTLAESAPVPSSGAGLSPAAILGVALLAALVLSPGAALVAERAGPRRVWGADELRHAGGGPLLVTVPRERRWPPARWSAAGAAGSRDDGQDRGEPTPTRDDDVRGAYRRLAAQVKRTGFRRVLVTSPSHGDGKTSVVVNLAHELERSGARVAVTGLDASGAVAAPTESDYYVLIDGPPLLDATNALALADYADAVMVVARQDHTPVSQVRTAGELLRSVGVTFVGSVLVGATR